MKVSISRSHVSRRSNRKFKPNLKRVKVTENGTSKHINICMRCLRSNQVKRK